jgi:hypothetical protein
VKLDHEGCDSAGIYYGAGGAIYRFENLATREVKNIRAYTRPQFKALFDKMTATIGKYERERGIEQ